MARGDMTILDIEIDAASRVALQRANVRFRLGLPTLRWWQRKEAFRELVRAALRTHWEAERTAARELCGCAHTAAEHRPSPMGNVGKGACWCGCQYFSEPVVGSGA